MSFSLIGAKLANEQVMQDIAKAKDDAEELTAAYSRLPVEDNGVNQHKHRGPDDLPGSYDHCGVSTCGSLRFPGTPGPHGLYKSMSIEEMTKEKQKLALFAKDRDSPSKTLPEVLLDFTENDKRNELYILEVSRLSARDEKFRKMLLKNKAANGYAESELFDLNTLRNKGKHRERGQKSSFEALDSTDAIYNNSLEVSSVIRTQSGILTDEDISLLEITRVNTAGSTSGSRSSSRSSKQRSSSFRSHSSKSIQQLKSPTRTSSQAMLPIMRTVDLQDIPELQLTKPPSSMKKEKPSTATLVGPKKNT
jgi:hypothetical protein